MQPVLATRTKQMEMWKDLILSYYRHHGLHELNINEPSALFCNAKIDRKLSSEAVRELVQQLIDEGYGEWKRNSTDVARIYWRKPTEWASILYKWIVSTGKTDSVCTLYELREGEEAEGEEFYLLDPGTMVAAIKILEQKGKAQVFKGNDADSVGVKFFS